MEMIKNVVNAAKRKAEESRKAKALTERYRKEQALKNKIKSAPATKKPALGSKPKTHDNIFEAIKTRRDLPSKY
jgi:hypothetical protein